MSDVEVACRIARSLPEAEVDAGEDEVHFSVRGKKFAWTFLDRAEDKAPRVPDVDVLAIRCTKDDKEALLASDSKKFFTTEHYNGFPAILVRLPKVKEDELRELLTDGWRCQVPKKLAKQLDAA